jgi:HlyD family secretion protein
MSPRRERPRGRARWVLAAAVAAAVLWWSAGRAAGERTGAWGEVRRADLVLGVEVRGVLAAVEPAVLRPPDIPDQWSLKIAFLAPEGQTVRRGTPVLRFDASDLDRKLIDRMSEEAAAAQELAKKRIDLQMAREDGELELAEARAKERKAALKVDVPPDIVAAADLRQWQLDLALVRRQIAYLTAKAGLARRQAEAAMAELARKRDRAASRVAEIRAQLASLNVRAPRDGIVVYVPGRQGEKKKVGDSAYQGESVVEIPDLRRLRGDAEIDEADLARVASGQPVLLRLDSRPDEPVAGRVAAIRAAVTADPRAGAGRQRTVEVELSLDRTDPLRMRPGMRFVGTIETARVPGALVVPADAVAATPDGPAVVRARAFGSEVVHPRLGRRNDRLVEVLAGLAAGDRVARGDAAAAGGGGPGR